MVLIFLTTLKNIMFPSMPVQGSKQERKLIKIFKLLDDDAKDSLFAFAEFLQSRSHISNEKAKVDISSSPLDIPRPEEESVVKAIKRLSATYPMVDKEGILHPISGLMTSHILQGRKALEVIDELESLFLKEYNNLSSTIQK